MIQAAKPDSTVSYEQRPPCIQGTVQHWQIDFYYYWESDERVSLALAEGQIVPLKQIF